MYEVDRGRFGYADASDEQAKKPLRLRVGVVGYEAVGDNCDGDVYGILRL
jgi:hypothetical protein